MTEASEIPSAGGLWFCRIVGPALLVSLAVGQFLVPPGSGPYEYVAGPLYLLAWVGSFLLFLEYRRSSVRFALPFGLIALAILLLVVAALLPVATASTQPDLRTLAATSARVVHGLAGLALAVIGWTTRAPAAA